MANKLSSDEGIKKAIEETGLPTEIKVTNLLRSSDWSVFNEFPYLDSDEGKIRTLDMRAMKTKVSKQDQSTPFIHTIELYIECKKSVKETWVFHVANEKDNPESYQMLVAQRIILEFMNETSKKKRKDEEQTCFNNIHVNYCENTIPYKIALSHQVIGGKDFLFEAYMQLIKTLIDSDRQATAHENKNKGGKAYPNYEFQVIPLIVFDGSMFECYYKENQLITSRTNFVRSIVNILPSQKIPALIDVITLDALPQYLKMLEDSFITQRVIKKFTK